MSRRLRIRQRTSRDLDTCAQVLVAVHERDGYPVEGVADPHTWLTPPGLLWAWVAELDRRVVGHVSVSRPTGEDAVTMLDSSSGEDTVGVLARLFVDPTARGLGLGERLVQTVTDEASAAGRRLVLDVMTKDQSAIRLYERLGWRYLGSTCHEVDGDECVPAYCYVSPEPHQ